MLYVNQNMQNIDKKAKYMFKMQITERMSKYHRFKKYKLKRPANNSHLDKI